MKFNFLTLTQTSLNIIDFAVRAKQNNEITLQQLKCKLRTNISKQVKYEFNVYQTQVVLLRHFQVLANIKKVCFSL